MFILYLFTKYFKQANWKEIPWTFIFHVETGLYFKASIQTEYCRCSGTTK